MMLTRRNFCAGLAAAICAPYVVRDSGILMPVSDRTITNDIVWAIKTTGGLLPGELPLGVVMPFARKAPEDWLPFDGRTIRREAHPLLFNSCGWSKYSKIELLMFGERPCYQQAQLIGHTTSGDGHKLFS